MLRITDSANCFRESIARNRGMLGLAQILVVRVVNLSRNPVSISREPLLMPCIRGSAKLADNGLELTTSGADDLTSRTGSCSRN